MNKGYFITISEAYSLTGNTGGANSEQMEKHLSDIGIFPAGRIKGMYGGKVVYRPFYDPDDIQLERVKKLKRDQKISQLNKELEKVEKLKREIANL